MNEIASAANAKFKRWASLLDSRGIKKEGAALVSGQKLVREFLESDPDAVEDILLPPKSTAEFNDRFRQTRLSSALFNELDSLGTHSPLLVIRVPKISEWNPADPKGLELIVALGDPANLGALLRSAEAFGASRVILTKECASPFLPKALKAAANSTFRVALAAAPSLNELKLTNAYGLDMEGESLHDFVWPKNCYLVLGEEGKGLPNLNLKKLRIPMKGKTESLNATVAASLALYSYGRGIGIS